MTRRQKALLRALIKGAADILPLSLAVLPWGVLFGSLAIQRGFSWLEAQLFSAMVFGGAVQIVAIELMAVNTPLLVVLFSAVVISSRHFLYGLALRERLISHPARWRMGLGFLLTDELFSVLSNKRAYLTKFRLYYALGAGGSFYLAWNMWTAIGIIAGTSLPDLTQLGLDFAIAAIFIALVVPEIKSIPILICVIMSAVSAVVFSIYQNDLALISAALVGMASGFLYKRMEDKP
jgi:4-azaleucine resistance transporter AzlC